MQTNNFITRLSLFSTSWIASHPQDVILTAMRRSGALYLFYFSLMPSHVPYELCGLPGCGRSATVFWGWDAHEAQLHCPDEVYGNIWIWSIRRVLNLSSTKLLRPWSPWENPHGRAGNWSRDLMISSQKLWPLDHEASHISNSLNRSLLNFKVFHRVCKSPRFNGIGSGCWSAQFSCNFEILLKHTTGMVWWLWLLRLFFCYFLLYASKINRT
jgi:hypothetical protein